MTTISTLSGLIDLMRSKGVTNLHVKDAEIEATIALGAEPIADTGAEPDVDAPQKVGKDGLTAAEQEALYGRVIDAK